MATISTTKNYKVGMMRKNEEGRYVFEEYAKEESKFYDVTELLDSILDQDGTSFAFKIGQDIPSDADAI